MDHIIGPILILSAVSGSPSMEAKRQASIAAYKQIGIESSVSNFTNLYIDRNIQDQAIVLYQINHILNTKTIVFNLTF